MDKLYVKLLDLLTSPDLPLEQVVNTYEISHRCGECNSVLSKRLVSLKEFEAIKDREFARIDRWGEDEESGPNFGKDTITFFSSLCNPCRKWVERQEARLMGRDWNNFDLEDDD